MTRRALLARTVAFFLALPLVSRLRPRATAETIRIEPAKTLCLMVGGPIGGTDRPTPISVSQIQVPFMQTAGDSLVWGGAERSLGATASFSAAIYDRVDATTFAFRESSWPEWAETQKKIEWMAGMLSRDEARRDMGAFI